MGKLKNVLTNNIFLKLLAVFVSAVVWLLIVNIDDPQQSRNFTSNVEVINSNVLTEQGKYYTIPDGGNTVTFRVTARRSVIEKLTTSDFLAIADMTYLEDDSRIPIEIRVLSHTNAVTLSSRLHYLYVNIGVEMSQRFQVQGGTTGDPADGCVVDDVRVFPDVISVTGPAEIVAQISVIEANCDVTGMNEDFSENVVPVFKDIQGNAIDTTKLSISDPTVQVRVSMTNVKVVPIMIETSGELGEGLELSSISTNPEHITIKGDRNILNDITEIVIPPSVIDLSMITGDMTTTVDITTYLPSGASLANSNETQVEIVVKVSQESSRAFQMPSENVSIRNLGSGLKLSFEDATIPVEISAVPSVLDSIKAEDITGSIDVSGMGEGEHTVRLEINQDPNYQASALTVKINITGE